MPIYWFVWWPTTLRYVIHRWWGGPITCLMASRQVDVNTLIISARCCQQWISLNDCGIVVCVNVHLRATDLTNWMRSHYTLTVWPIVDVQIIRSVVMTSVQHCAFTCMLSNGNNIGLTIERGTLTVHNNEVCFRLYWIKSFLNWIWMVDLKQISFLFICLISKTKVFSKEQVRNLSGYSSP